MWAGLQSEAGVEFRDNHSTYPTFTMMNAASFATGGFGIDRLLRQHPLATDAQASDSANVAVDLQAARHPVQVMIALGLAMRCPQGPQVLANGSNLTLNPGRDSRRARCMQVWRMRTGISITLKPVDRRRLTTVAGDHNAPHKHVWRAEIVLLSADGVGTNEIMRRTGKSKTCVWRWQERFMQAGYGGLLRDKTRPSRIPPLGSDIAKRVVALTRTDPPAEATHWTATMMAKAVGISASSVQRIWRTHGLQPHRVHQFKLSNDPKFIDKLRDVVGLYVDPPAHAIVLSVDEKGFFANLAKRRLKRGVFRCVVDLQATINCFVAETNHDPKPFTWTADPDKIIAAVRRGHQVLDSIH